MSERLTALRNLTISSTATYVENATGLLASVLIARSLGPIGYADYAFAIWLSGWLIRACNHALTTISIRFIAEARGAGDEARAQALLNFLLRMQAVSSAIVLGLFALSCALAAPDGWSNNPVLIPLLILVSVYARAAFWMGGAVGKGYERFEVESASLVVMALMFMDARTYFVDYLDGHQRYSPEVPLNIAHRYLIDVQARTADQPLQIACVGLNQDICRGTTLQFFVPQLIARADIVTDLPNLDAVPNKEGRMQVVLINALLTNEVRHASERYAPAPPHILFDLLGQPLFVAYERP